MLSAIFGILFIAFSLREISCDEADEIGEDFAFLSSFKCPVSRYFVVTKDNGHFVFGCDQKIELKHCVTYLTENSISYINRSRTFELRNDENAKGYNEEDVKTAYQLCKDAHEEYQKHRNAVNHTTFEDYFQSMKESVLRADWITFGVQNGVVNEVFYCHTTPGTKCQNVNSTFAEAMEFDNLPVAKKKRPDEKGAEALSGVCNGDKLLFLNGVSLYACPEKDEKSQALYEGCCPKVGEDKMECYIGNPSKHYNYVLTLTEDESEKKFTFDDGAPTQHEQCVKLARDHNLKELNNQTMFDKLRERTIKKSDVA